MSKKLLLADDSITIQKVIGITFANEDFDLIITDNGDTALEKIRSQGPDLILADVYMPGKNGYELCSTVKQDQALKHIPVLLLTGTFEPFDEAKARSVGADGWIAKPFESQSLIAKVDELMSKAPETAPPAPAPPSAETPEPPPAPSEPQPAPEPAAEASGDDIWSDMGDLDSEPETPAAAAEPGGQSPTEKEWEEGLIADDEETGEEDLWGSVSFDEEDLAPAAEPEAAGSEGVFEGLEEEGGQAGPEAEPAPAEGDLEPPLGAEETFEFDEEPVFEEEAAPAGDEGGIEFDEDTFEFDDEPLIEESEREEGLPEGEDVLEIEEEPRESFAPAEKEGEVEFEMEDFEFEEESVSEESAAAGIDVAAEAESVVPPAPVEGEDGETEEEILALDEAEILEEEDLEEELGEETEEGPVSAEEDVEPSPPLREEPSDELPHPENQHAAGEGEWGFEEPLPAPELTDEAMTPAPAEEAPAQAASTEEVEERVARMTEEELQKVVEKVAGQVIERLAGTLLEKIAWEVVPDLAESMIREEIRKIKDAAQ